MLLRLIEIIKNIEPSGSGFANSAIQAIAFEIIMVLMIPLTGILVNAIIVRGLNGAIARIIGGRGAYFFSNYFLFAGVVIHELSHALFALVTGAEVTEIALFSPDENSLGHVCYRTRGSAFWAALQNCFSSCAPVVTGIVLSTLIVSELFPVLGALWQWVIAMYLLVSVVFHMNMSGADLKNYFRGVAVLMLIALPFCIIYFLFFA